MNTGPGRNRSSPLRQDGRAGDVGRQQVGGELDAGEVAAPAPRPRLGPSASWPPRARPRGGRGPPPGRPRAGGRRWPAGRPRPWPPARRAALGGRPARGRPPVGEAGGTGGPGAPGSGRWAPHPPGFGKRGRSALTPARRRASLVRSAGSVAGRRRASTSEWIVAEVDGGGRHPRDVGGGREASPSAQRPLGRGPQERPLRGGGEALQGGDRGVELGQRAAARPPPAPARAGWRRRARRPVAAAPARSTADQRNRPGSAARPLLAVKPCRCSANTTGRPRSPTSTLAKVALSRAPRRYSCTAAASDRSTRRPASDVGHGGQRARLAPEDRRAAPTALNPGRFDDSTTCTPAVSGTLASARHAATGRPNRGSLPSTAPTHPSTPSPPATNRPPAATNATSGTRASVPRS